MPYPHLATGLHRSPHIPEKQQKQRLCWYPEGNKLSSKKHWYYIQGAIFFKIGKFRQEFLSRGSRDEVIRNASLQNRSFHNLVGVFVDRHPKPVTTTSLIKCPSLRISLPVDNSFNFSTPHPEPEIPARRVMQDLTRLTGVTSSYL